MVGKRAKMAPKKIENNFKRNLKKNGDAVKNRVKKVESLLLKKRDQNYWHMKYPPLGLNQFPHHHCVGGTLWGTISMNKNQLRVSMIIISESHTLDIFECVWPCGQRYHDHMLLTVNIPSVKVIDHMTRTWRSLIGSTFRLNELSAPIVISCIVLPFVLLDYLNHE